MNTTNATLPLNSTLPTNSSISASSSCHEVPDTSNEFTVQNVVGIFLTLSLCLLTQPYGSLFYNPPTSDGRAKITQKLFFPWRLNPLACIAETVVILFGLAQALREAMQEPDLKEYVRPSATFFPFTVSKTFPFIRGRGDGLSGVGGEQARKWTRHWHVHAAALLLIRANEKGGAGGDGVLDRLMAKSLLRGEGMDDERGDLAANAESGEDGGVVHAPQSEGIVMTFEEGLSTGGELQGGQNTGTDGDQVPVTAISSSGVDSPEPQPGVIRRRTSQLEAGLPAEPDPPADSGPGSEAFDGPGDRLADLRKVLGSNVLAHKERWVNLVTSFSVLVVIIKLAATTLPWTVRVPAAFFLAGWSSVQFLLYLLHLGDLDQNSAILVVKAIRVHRHHAAAPSTEGWLLSSITLAVAGPIIWLSYYNGFKNPGVAMISGDYDVTLAYGIYQSPITLIWWGAYLVIFFGLFGIVLGFAAGIPMAIFSKGKKDIQLRGVIIILVLSVGAGLGFGAAMKAMFDSERGAGFFIGLISTACLLGSVLLLWALLMVPARTIASLDKMSSGETAGFVVFDAVLSLYLFGLLLFTYDSAGSYKPSWLELLG